MITLIALWISAKYNRDLGFVFLGTVVLDIILIKLAYILGG